MVFTIVTSALALLGVLGIWAVVGGHLDRVGRLPDQIEVCGPFELITRDARSWYSHSIRHRGSSFTPRDVDGVGHEHPNALISLASPIPAFLVHVGDPNNAGAYYLVHEVDGLPRAEFLTESRGGVSADWVDDPAGGRELRDITVHRRRLEGGRYLLVDDTCVLDTHTLTAHRFVMPTGCAPVSFRGSLGLSPRATSFARLATDDEGRACVLAICFLDGIAEALPIDRDRMRYQELEDLDAAWLAHHFAWQADENGLDRLSVRPDFQPLPHRGRLTVRSDGYREYRLPPSSPALLDTLLGFVRREFPPQGEAAPAELLAGEDGATLRFGSGEVRVAYFENHVAAYSMGNGSSRPVLLLARRFDEELASGRHDHLFGGNPSETP